MCAIKTQWELVIVFIHVGSAHDVSSRRFICTQTKFSMWCVRTQEYFVQTNKVMLEVVCVCVCFDVDAKLSNIIHKGASTIHLFVL